MAAPDRKPASDAVFQPLRAIGLMSGTSMDGVDAAYVETDGQRVIVRGEARTTPFDRDFRARLKAYILSGPVRDGGAEERGLEAELTDLHVKAVQALVERMGKNLRDIDIIGFHGQTIWHKPQQHLTWQMGDGARLAKALNVPVAYDFRSDDVKAGGQGAPLLPIFHAALAPESNAPVVILNLGGVGNITYIPGGAETDFQGLLGFDTGPGNGMIDDWMMKHFDKPMDPGGMTAARGRVHEDVVAQMLAAPFFARKPPKSLDRFDFSAAPVEGLSPEDGAATLTAFTAASVVRGLDQCPARPARIYVAGGGRHNDTLMQMLAKRSGAIVASVDSLGWEGDALEAQAFAYFAVRCARGLPLTFPCTTGVKAPLTGGKLVKP
ncbi:MAG: anhydro-N-acetylmuramic acid kinase [Rhodospirillaceae bacterium]|nr:anhydro-N-acetylmuramic acid kinase [Rhodospirillaceae bacterium]